MIATREEEPVSIDEPENSLHPTWQREYVDKVLAALEYRNATVVIATHAPLVVTGALARFPELVSVFRVNHGDVARLELSGDPKSVESIEEILWRAFEVITPASHFVSEKLVGVVAQLDGGEIDRDAALERVNELDRQSFDDQQRAFFGAVRELIDQVDRGAQERTAMTDPYMPTLVAFAFAPAEEAIVALAMASNKPWDYEPVSDAEKAALKAAKDRILAYHLARHGGNCCYCRTNISKPRGIS